MLVQTTQYIPNDTITLLQILVLVSIIQLSVYLLFIYSPDPALKPHFPCLYYVCF